jgi:hypothetical protein
MSRDGLDVIGSELMSDLFWDQMTPYSPKDMELKFEKRLIKQHADIDILILDESLSDEDSLKLINEYFSIHPPMKIELHRIKPLSDYLKNNSLILFDSHQRDSSFPTTKHRKNVLFTLKASHVAWDDKHKSKTFYDLYLMSHAGCTIIPELYYELIEFWKNKFGSKWRADFTQESVDFFDDAVSRPELHDELHWKMMKFDKPAYMYLQEEGQTTVYVDEKKFWEVDEDIRRAVVIGEAQALAIERYIEPGVKVTPRWAYIKFVEGLVDRLAPLWMTEYIVNNFSYFIDYNEDYVKKYKE